MNIKDRSLRKMSKNRKIDVYLIYSRTDGYEYARILRNILVESGVNVLWDDDNIRGGERWADALQNLIRNADAIIFLGTPEAQRSQWIRNELEYSYQRQIRILPIIFDDLHGINRLPPFLHTIAYAKEERTALTSGPSQHLLKLLLEALDAIELPAITRPTKSISPRRKAKQPLNEGKLILVGRGEVGKTSLVRRLSKKEFRGDESKTQGINITTWPLKLGSETIQMNVWDFGGQEIMHATHQFFLTERSLYLLVLNGREGGEDMDAEYWLRHISTFGSESNIIVVQNKISQHPFDLNYRGLQSVFPQISAFVKTDCKDGIGIEELENKIQQVASEMSEIRMAFPSDWFTVKSRLESMKQDFIGYEDFRQLCNEEGIDNESDRDTLAWALHCLGIALNYRDDSRLRETSVLRPEWVTEGIYKVLNAECLAKRQGELHLNDLQKLLPSKRYPRGKHYFLLEIMRKFSLCFAFPDEPDRYLIPELLGKEEPTDVSEFGPGDCLNFEYHYGVLPEGLLPRFIVRSNPLSRGQERWRSGVILAHEDCKALIQDSQANRTVVIRVKGNDAGARRRLLAIIRYDFDRINGEFKDRLDAQQKIPLMDFPEFSIDYKKLLAFEKKGVTEFPEFIGSDVITVQVNDLLNGVDLKSQREDTTGAMITAKTVFFSYSHKDEALRDELEIHLKLLQRQNVISAWHDRKILPGSEWDQEIDHYLERAQIILLLISADFIASDYCWDKEVELAMMRHEANEAVVIPIMLRPCDWKDTPFGRLQGLPRKMKPVTTWGNRDAAWTDVVKGIRRTAENL